MDVTEFERTANIVNGMHARIAGDVFPRGAVVRCQECGAERALTTSECGHFLARGWPECHGATMALQGSKTLDLEDAKTASA